MITTKGLLKKLLPGGIYYLLGLIKNRSSLLYSSSTFFKSPGSVSDFFTWSPYAKKTYFVAENLRALLKGEKVKVTHFLTFYSSQGAFLHKYSHSSDEFFCRIEIKRFEDNMEYCSFTHRVEPFETEDANFKDLLMHSRKLVCEQNRGYCIYYPSNESSIGSMVHGNFGGISNEGSLLAKQRALHLYTPSYIFESQNEYDLVFNNPTNKKLKILVNYNSTGNSLDENIKPLGTCSVRIVNYAGTLTFESKLPVCRPTIFKNPDCKRSNDFDVLHS